MYRKEITNNLVVILMREPNPELGIVVHECHHATMMTLADSGVDDRNHEVSAYLLENLVRICMNAINKNNKKEKKKQRTQMNTRKPPINSPRSAATRLTPTPDLLSKQVKY